jgi:uncharacterized membrane protein
MNSLLASPIKLSLFLINLLFFGLMAGFFYAYSISVMWGLDLQKPEIAISAMQGINISVRNGFFIITYLSPPLIALVLSFISWRSGNLLSALLLFAATLIYSLGVLLPTTSINVQLNNTLAEIEPAQFKGNIEHTWQVYSERWQLWNTIRGCLCICSFLLSLIAFNLSSKASSA